jgi:DNA-binding response OmpR family regulator
MRVLLVEDDPLLGDGVCAGLKQSGFAVDWVTDGQMAQHALGSEEYSLVVLDIGLPKISGLDLLKWLRQRGSNLPVLMLTARDTVADRVGGLDSGADDYLVKPFDLDELVARLRALIRRAAGKAAPTLQHGSILVDQTAHTVTLDGTPTELSAREFALLVELMQNSGRVLSREQLEQRLYGWGEEVESNSVEVHIHHLRKKLGAELIRTVRGVGYTMDKPGAA